MAEEKTKEKQMISVKEFRMWLEGVEEMQAEGWVPDARQWVRIREKIDTIEDASKGAAMQFRGGPEAPAMLPPGMQFAFPPLNTAPPGPPGTMAAGVPSGPSALNTMPTPPQAPPQRMAVTPGGLPVTLASGSPTVPVRTPDIDTSHGKGYRPAFE